MANTHGYLANTRPVRSIITHQYIHSRSDHTKHKTFTQSLQAKSRKEDSKHSNHASHTITDKRGSHTSSRRERRCTALSRSQTRIRHGPDSRVASLREGKGLEPTGRAVVRARTEFERLAGLRTAPSCGWLQKPRGQKRSLRVVSSLASVETVDSCVVGVWIFIRRTAGERVFARY